MTVNPSPLAETAASLRSGERPLDHYLDDVFDRLDAVDVDVQAFLPEPDRRERVEREKTTLQNRFDGDAPPLFGVPVGVKDIFHVDGLPTRAGSSLPPDVLAGPQSTAVSRLESAGAFVLGKTVTTEFAYFAPGPTRNPHNLAHTPGGSSSGSAAAVAAGLCPIALGTQTVGSTIRPAAFCGIVGYKPSYGRIDTGGLVTFSQSADHVGVFTQDVSGMRLTASILVDDWVDTDPVDDPALGIPTGPYLDSASDEGLAAFDDQVTALETAGYAVEEVPTFEEFGAVVESHNRMIAAEFALYHHEWYEAYGDRYDEWSASLVEDGKVVSIDELGTERARRLARREAMEDRMAEAGVDLWVCPAAPGPAPNGIDSTGDPVMNLPWTNLGLPAVTVPAGTASNGLPLGFQCVGRYGADEQVLSWAEAIRTVFEADGE